MHRLIGWFLWLILVKYVSIFLEMLKYTLDLGAGYEK